jgi:hypothetical protein
MERGRDKAIMLAQALGCKTQDNQKLVECLNNRPTQQVVQQVENFQVRQIQCRSVWSTIWDSKAEIINKTFGSILSTQNLHRQFCLLIVNLLQEVELGGM